MEKQEKNLLVTADYLQFPICAGKVDQLIEIFLAEPGDDLKKIFEFMIPMDETAEREYTGDFVAEIPIREFRGREIVVRGKMTDSFAAAITVGERRQAKEEKRPVIHFTTGTGWTNDPNGMIYADGLYHMYYQYNPMDIIWNNMSWGHAVSRDLLHWEEKEPVLFPDAYGPAFSGCAISNKRGMLGLPEDALLFYYTAAGGSNVWSRDVEFTQRIAYSLDGGETLKKIEKPCIPTICNANRDPKVYWHEESQGYIMVLWMENNDYAIFRSADLLNWEETDRLTLDDAWECPDIFRLYTEDGDSCWFFWTADGFYYTGEFDGYHFTRTGEKQYAYTTKLPYAAQTFVDTPGRVISVSWLRMENDGRLFTSTYGVPVEMSCRKTEQGYILIQKPVRELMAYSKLLDKDAMIKGDQLVYSGQEAAREKKALVVDMTLSSDHENAYTWQINGSNVSYDCQTGNFAVDDASWNVGAGHEVLLFIVDDRILEVFFDQGLRVGSFLVNNQEVTLETSVGQFESVSVFDVK